MSATSHPASKPGLSRTTLAGVLYAEDFDEEAPAVDAVEDQAPEPELIEPTFSSADLAAAAAEGRAAGRAEAERGIIASRVQVLAQVAAAMEGAREQAQEAAEQAAEATSRCLLTALSTCLPALCSRHGAGELRAVIRAVLPALLEEPRIVVRVHPHMTPVMEEELAALDFEIAERVSLHPSEAIPPGDVRVTWADGSAGRSGARARAAVEDALAVLGLLERNTLPSEMIDA